MLLCELLKGWWWRVCLFFQFGCNVPPLPNALTRRSLLRGVFPRFPVRFFPAGIGRWFLITLIFRVFIFIFSYTPFYITYSYTFPDL